MTIIAIDGPAASGKGTIARRLAAELRMDYLDSGLLYRAVALSAFKKGLNEANVSQLITIAQNINSMDLINPDLREEHISQFASKLAAIPEVREALISYQRCFVKQKYGAVLDGRDIGTVICPDADLKFFISATPEVRAERRYQELIGGGKEANLEEVIADIIARDKRDSERKFSPLRPAEDAIVIDNSNLDAEATYQLVREYCFSAKGVKA